MLVGSHSIDDILCIAKYAMHKKDNSIVFNMDLGRCFNYLRDTLYVGFCTCTRHRSMIQFNNCLVHPFYALLCTNTSYKYYVPLSIDAVLYYSEHYKDIEDMEIIQELLSN